MAVSSRDKAWTTGCKRLCSFVGNVDGLRLEKDGAYDVVELWDFCEMCERFETWVA
jgi:hypothetical protein